MQACGLAARCSMGQCFRNGIDLEVRKRKCSLVSPLSTSSLISHTRGFFLSALIIRANISIFLFNLYYSLIFRRQTFLSERIRHALLVSVHLITAVHVLVPNALIMLNIKLQNKNHAPLSKSVLSSFHTGKNSHLHIVFNFKLHIFHFEVLSSQLTSFIIDWNRVDYKSVLAISTPV